MSNAGKWSDEYDAMILVIIAESTESVGLLTGYRDPQSGARWILPVTCLMVKRYISVFFLRSNSMGLDTRSKGWSKKIGINGL